MTSRRLPMMGALRPISTLLAYCSRYTWKAQTVGGGTERKAGGIRLQRSCGLILNGGASISQFEQ